MKPRDLKFLLFLILFGPTSVQAQVDLSFVDRAGCLQCHGGDVRGNGPNFQEMAERYQNSENNRAQMRNTIRNGGFGNWADVTNGKSMPPYSNLLSEQEIDALINWILQQDQ